MSDLHLHRIPEHTPETWGHWCPITQSHPPPGQTVWQSQTVQL